MRPEVVLRGALAALALMPPAAGAAAVAEGTLTCEQIFAVAQASVRFRDQGHSLDRVLDGLREVDAQRRLSASEMSLLRNAVSIAYLGNASPEEIALQCVRSRR